MRQGDRDQSGARLGARKKEKEKEREKERRISTSRRRKLTPHEYNIRKGTCRSDRCRSWLGYTTIRLYTLRILTSAVFPERYAAVLLREVRRLERVLVLEFPMRHLAAGERDDA